RRSHAVLVVFADIDDGKLPKLGHVERFVEDALVDRGFTKEAKRHLIGPLILGRVCHTGSDTDLAANDAVSAKELQISREHVHRPAFAFYAAADLPVEL